MSTPISATGLALALFALTPATAISHELRGYIDVEYRYFLEDPLYEEQHGSNVSVSTQPEYYHEWDDGRQIFTFTPFLRIDQHDEERTHFDIRELSWLGVYDDWELRIGFRKVFWGVTESQHLVDIINQTDLVENIDGEDKLGQPMINAAFIRDWGTVDLFVLTGFRERTFPGKEGRLRPQYYVDTNQTTYESSQEDKHIDYAIRYSHYINEWEFGLSHFYGTSRDPILEPGISSQGENVLTPFYPLIHQTGLDVQAIFDSWLLKMEFISREDNIDRHAALTTGFEHTFVMVFDSRADLGLISEYLYNERDEISPFQNDIMVGLRLALNDVQSTSLLLGTIFDLDSDDKFYNLEAERRIGDAWKLSLEARILSGLNNKSFQYDLRDDDYIQLDLAWYF